MSAANITIKPVKFITKQLWNTAIDIFTANYKGRARKLSYDAAKNYEMALAYDGDRMVGFVKILNLLMLSQDMESDHVLWDANRTDCNTKMIQVCWVHPKYRGRGLATKLYKFAIDRMGADSINIESKRVAKKVAYWQTLGFTYAMVYGLNGDVNFRLHIQNDKVAKLTDANENFANLDDIGILSVLSFAKSHYGCAV